MFSYSIKRTCKVYYSGIIKITKLVQDERKRFRVPVILDLEAFLGNISDRRSWHKKIIEIRGLKLQRSLGVIADVFKMT